MSYHYQWETLIISNTIKFHVTYLSMLYLYRDSCVFSLFMYLWHVSDICVACAVEIFGKFAELISLIYRSRARVTTQFRAIWSNLKRIVRFQRRSHDLCETRNFAKVCVRAQLKEKCFLGMVPCAIIGLVLFVENLNRLSYRKSICIYLYVYNTFL